MGENNEDRLVIELDELLEETKSSAREELSAPVEIIDIDYVPSPDEMFVEARKWLRMRDVAVVVVDLKNSTKLTWDEAAKGSARIYEAVTGNVVRIVKRFKPGFVDIQGDGMFAIFGGDDRYERAMCAAITAKAFSEKGLLPAREDHVEEKLRDTGLKVGMAAGMLAVKRVGKSGDQSEPIWAGKQLNWASSARGPRTATSPLSPSGCSTASRTTSSPATRAAAPRRGTSGRIRRSRSCRRWNCKLLTSRWCDTCGGDFCQAVLDGETARDDVDPAAIRRAEAATRRAA